MLSTGLRYLVKICDDLGLKDQVADYVSKLSKAERNNWNSDKETTATGT
jgi:hypothetical protein